MKTPKMSVPAFQFSVLGKEHVEQVTKLFTDAFCHAEPMTHYLNMDQEKYRIFARAVTEKGCEDKLSIVALDGDKVAACAIVEDLANPGEIPDFDPNFVYILALLEKLGENFFPDKKFPPRHIAHLFITAVDENYRRMGLSKAVNLKAAEWCAKQGFDFMYCEFTHHFNEKGTIPALDTKQHIGTVQYNRFEHNERKPFEFLTGSAKSYLWALRENAQLIYTSEKNARD